jgi:steroid 5-alpha reductase family enzyme
MDRPTKPETPELDKASKIRAQSQAIGEFIEWLPEQAMTICTYSDADEAYFPSGFNINTLLAKFFGLDEDKMEAERRALLEYARQLNEHYEEVERAARGE